jgi:hypothetical protein
MKLTLDHTQRLNLHALLGAQRADVGPVRAIWAVQDRLALDDEEGRAIELKRELVNGQERTVRNSALSLAAKEFEFPEAEATRIPTTLQTWDSYACGDRRWPEPLVEALFPSDFAKA